MRFIPLGEACNHVSPTNREDSQKNVIARNFSSMFRAAQQSAHNRKTDDKRNIVEIIVVTYPFLVVIVSEYDEC